MNEKYILTPEPSEKPRINGAKVFGARPGAPFLFKVAASGIKPMKYSVENLPSGLSIDAETGIITGSVANEGEFNVKITVENEKGSASRQLKIKIGDKICLTPPMGWNSWYVNSLWVSQKKIEKIAQAFVDSGLIDHGWTYVNIDDCWQGQRSKETNILKPNAKFPNMKEMCDKIHALGLKVGIYSTPWVGSYAGYQGTSSPNEEHDYSEFFVPEEDRLEPFQFTGNDNLKRRKMRYFGTYFGDEDAQQWADWGFDYLKYDWNPNDMPHIKQMEDSLRKTGRDIVYSLSNSSPINIADEIKEHANVWRTTGDIRDIWYSISKIGFSQEKWHPYGGPGHWNDPDMLQVGKTATPHKATPEYRNSRLSADEQYTQVSLWSLLSAPLLLSCDIADMDKFTFSLLSNDEVIEVNQDPLGDGAVPIAKTGFLKTEILAKSMEDGSKAVGLFNRSPIKKKMKLDLSSLGFSGKCKVRDLWRQKDLGVFDSEFSAKVNSHGVVLIRVSKA